VTTKGGARAGCPGPNPPREPEKLGAMQVKGGPAAYPAMGGKKTPGKSAAGEFFSAFGPHPHGALRLCPPKERRGHGSPVVAPAANARRQLQYKTKAHLKNEPLVAYPKL